MNRKKINRFEEKTPKRKNRVNTNKKVRGKKGE